ncbi:putative toxin-antitoxin system toxin component, PIN family [Caenispirillum bisanense]|uniref:putative toxin-antitoxin system toxin component, PIN family n=1 Tax=Caenispirillum bisanense TaxID=414052 RepID=UPI0031D3E683
MLRVVLDTNVLVAALRSRRGASNAILRRVAERELVPLATVALFVEYEGVLKRPQLLALTGWDEATVDRFLDGMKAFVEPVTVNFSWRPQLKDPGDELVLEAAVNGGAAVLVTHNLRDFCPACDRFGLSVMTPGALMRRMCS